MLLGPLLVLLVRAKRSAAVILDGDRFRARELFWTRTVPMDRIRSSTRRQTTSTG